MKIRLGELRLRILQALNEQVDDDDTVQIDEVDTDPSNNPGRPADAYEYLGMHPKPTAAMSPPYAAGGGGEGGAGSPADPPDEPSKSEQG